MDGSVVVLGVAALATAVAAVVAAVVAAAATACAGAAAAGRGPLAWPATRLISECVLVRTVVIPVHA